MNDSQSAILLSQVTYRGSVSYITMTSTQSPVAATNSIIVPKSKLWVRRKERELYDRVLRADMQIPALASAVLEIVLADSISCKRAS